MSEQLRLGGGSFKIKAPFASRIGCHINNVFTGALAREFLQLIP